MIRANQKLKWKALKAVKDGEDIEAIKKAMDELQQEFYAISSKLYQQNPEAAQGAGFDPNNMGGAEANQGSSR